MNSTIKLLLFIPFVAVISLQSCKGLRKAGGTAEEKAWKTTLQNAEKETVTYNTLALSGRAQLNIPAMNLNNMGVSYRVSMDRGNKIWIKVSKVFEIARLLARPDSLFVLDKFNRRLMACDYQMAEEFTGLEMDFELLQDLLLGNFNPIPDDLSPGITEEGRQAFQGAKAGSAFKYLIDNQSYKVREIHAKNSSLNQETKITYSDFAEEGNTLMPFNALIELNSPDEASINLTHRKVDINPSEASFSFNVPSGYAKSGCK